MERRTGIRDAALTRFLSHRRLIERLTFYLFPANYYETMAEELSR